MSSIETNYTMVIIAKTTVAQLEESSHTQLRVDLQAAGSPLAAPADFFCYAKHYYCT